MTTRISLVFSLMLVFFFVVTNCTQKAAEGADTTEVTPKPEMEMNAAEPETIEPSNPLLDGTTVPTAKELWDLIAGNDFAYRNWNKFPSLDSMEYPVPVDELPHGDWVSVYVNDPAFTSIQQQMATPQTNYSAPYGSVCVKENYPAGATAPPVSSLLSVTVMYKIKGFDFAPGAGEWYYAMYKPDGSGEVVTLSEAQGFINQKDNSVGATFSVFRGEVLAGKPFFCLSCHRAAENYAGANFDYVGDYLFELKPFLVVK